MVRQHRHNPILAARGLCQMFAGMQTPGALAAAIRYHEFMTHQIAFVKAHKKKA